MKSSFQFKSYKVDKLSLEVQRTIDVLELKAVPEEHWQFRFRVRNPIHIKSQNQFLAGLDCLISLPDLDKEKTFPPSLENSKVVLEVGIAGLFVASLLDLEKKSMEQIVKVQMPSLLAAYLRSTVTSVLANAGFGSFIFPLVNFHKVAESANLEIEEMQLESEGA